MCIRDSKPHFSAVAFSADGASVIAGGTSRFVCVYAIAQKVLVTKFRVSHHRDADALGDDALFDAKLPVGERRRVHAALCALVAQKPRFKALVVDLAKISNGETSLDAILAYEIAPQ